MQNTPIAIQLYSVRGECDKSLPATLDSISRIGYTGAEPWGFDGSTLTWQGRSGHEVRNLYDDSGLQCCGFHVATDALLGDNLSRTIEFNRLLGNRFIIVAWDKPRMSSRSGIAELAGILNDAAEKLAPHGMFTGYHAHGFDFAKVDGEIAWDVLFASTRQKVIMQLDIGNCASGGGDPIATLRKFPGRARSVHLKDYGGPKGSALGEGTMDWPTIFELCRTLHQPEWYVVEEGEDKGLGFDVARRSLMVLRQMGL